MAKRHLTRDGRELRRQADRFVRDVLQVMKNRYQGGGRAWWV